MGNCLAKQKEKDLETTVQINELPRIPPFNSDPQTIVTTESNINDIDANTITNNHQNGNIMDLSSTNIIQDTNLFAKEAVRIAHTFWSDAVMSLSLDNRKEIGVNLYAQMFRKMPKCRKIFLRGEIQKTSEKFLNMIGWLVTELHSNYEKIENETKIDYNDENKEIEINKTNMIGYNVWEKLIILGRSHEQWGVTYENFLPMLEAFHKTFQERFPKGYTMRVKFCIENLYMNAARLMTKKDFHTLFMERVRDLETLEFLDSLDACLAHPTGREYLERYMEQCFMKEYVIFFRLFDEYKQLGNSGQRYEKAREMYFTNFHINGGAMIDVENMSEPKEARDAIESLKLELDKFDKALENKESYELSEKLLDDIYAQVKKIIEEQSWKQFCEGINSIKEATSTKKHVNSQINEL